VLRETNLAVRLAVVAPRAAAIRMVAAPPGIRANRGAFDFPSAVHVVHSA
jgi:hypothetical protein